MAQKMKESKTKESGETGVSESASGSAEMTDSPRDQRALEVVNRFSLWSGAAGFIPIPLLDGVLVCGQR